MGTGHAGRLWLIGGAVAAVVLVAVGWFFLISPANGRTAGLTGQTETARTKVASLQHHLNELQAQSERLPEYQATLKNDQAALPTTASLSDFLRSLQLGDDSRGAITGITVGQPLERPAGATTDFALPVTVSATGKAPQFDALLDYLQNVQPRAVLIKNVQLASDGGTTLDGPAKLTVSQELFVAAPPAK